MTWTADWKKWTQTTYGIIHAVQLGSQGDLGAYSEVEQSVRSASEWVTSNLGFSSAATRRQLRPGSIEIGVDQTPSVLARLRPATIELLLVGTASVTEQLLSDLLVENKVAQKPQELAKALQLLQRSLREKKGDTTAMHQWALVATHEMRIIRNCIVHARSIWTERAVGDLKDRTKSPLPKVGSSLSVALDDLFRYRRAARTVLNAAARI